MITTSPNMVHGALRAIIIHKKNIEINGRTLKHRGLLNMAIVLYTTYPNVFPQWNSFILNPPPVTTEGQ